jgi:MFS family permease
MSPPESAPTRPWGLVALLVAGMKISFFDRGNLSVAAPVIGPQLGIKPTEFGWLFSAFFFTYAFCQIGVGWLCDRIDVKWVYAGGFLIRLVPWLAFAPRLGQAANPGDATGPSSAPVIGWRELFRRRAFWGTCGGIFTRRPRHSLDPQRPDAGPD